jgi:UDP:flavonoid glycosyltransferase YjiC (YdhE family)
VRLLIISPDYLSHFLPMSAVAAAWRASGGDVTVATGRSLRERVTAATLDWHELRMSRGSNAGNVGDGSADDDLRPFFAATRRGMVATLRYQAEQRGTDLLWEPEAVARATIEVVDRVAPDAILVDHLAFAATLGLRAAGIPFTTFVPGHPTQLPVADEVYGFPVRWPAAIGADRAELAELRRCCDGVAGRFTDRYNDVLRRLDPSAPPVADAFGAHGDDVLFNSAPAVADPARLLPFRHAFLGSCVRPEQADRATRRWLESDEPFTYVSFGTFLSRREDVLADVAATLRRRGGRVALATGSARPAALGPLPAGWHVAPTLPQVTLLTSAAAAITHGGNNSVTECLAAGVPMVVLPFSTDQFAIAADLERADAATALDPNAPLHDALDLALDGTRGARRRSVVGRIADQLRAPAGPAIAVERLRPVSTERAP